MGPGIVAVAQPTENGHGMSLRFGTDGVRGVAGAELTPELALALGRATVRILGPADAVALGRDTRWSGPMLAAAFTAGAAAEGATVLDLGVVPTPAVAWASATLGVPGAVISASHNPFADNGIKLFAAGGRKLTDAVEAAVEAHLGVPVDLATVGVGTAIGGAGDPAQAAALVERWHVSVVAALGGRRLDGLRVVLDCANGAAAVAGPAVLEALGAEVVALLGVEPDGTNINASCGATDTTALRRAVLDHGAAVGIALDGDADRCIAVDATGAVVDGDQLIALLAVDRHERGALPGDAVAVTVMTNLGFRRAMAGRGIGVVETPVGDRAVLDALETHGLALGGEQSGHVIQRDLATTGDGLLTAVSVLDVVVRRRSLAELAAVMVRLPQVLRNVRVRPGARRPAEVVAAVAAEVAAAEAELDGRGRVLLRPSGTEPVVRVMAEADTVTLAEAVVARLTKAVGAAAGA